MTFSDFASAQSFYIWSILLLSVALGMVVNKTNFCTMGAVSDLVNIGDKGRLRAWILAATVAMIGVTLLEYIGVINVSSTLPPYRGGANPQTLLYTFPWGRFVLGGFLFGIGMTLASGCGNKTLIRIGGGNIKSIFVLVIIAVISYYMVDPFKELESNWYQALFQPWLDSASFFMTTPSDLGSITAGILGSDTPRTMRLVFGLLVGAMALFFVFKNKGFIKEHDNLLVGVAIGIIVISAWYLTANIKIDLDGEEVGMRNFVTEQWEIEMNEDDAKPKNAATNLNTTSYTFISPMGQLAGYVKQGFSASYFSFGVIAVLGVILGSFLWALISRSFRFEWFVDTKDAVMHAIGAVLMGFGGVLGLGCTVGQAITGVSTLAMGSFLVFGSIVFGSALTMKISYYKMCYEDEADFNIFKAFIAALVDMKLLPSKLRQLDAV